MAVTVTDTRTILVGPSSTQADADATTNWSGDATPQLTTSTTEIAETTGAIAMQLNIAEGSCWYNCTSVDISDQLLYVWFSNTAIRCGWKDTTAVNTNGGGFGTATGLYLSDGTNTVVFYMSGYDKRLFSHSAILPVQYECLVFDTSLGSSVDSSEYRVLAGSFGSLSYTAITDVGIYFETLSKALGGGYNCFVDVIRHGNSGLTITGGTTGARGTFAEIVADEVDYSTNENSFGVIREYSTKTYGLQAGLTFGETTSGDSWFQDTDVTLIFEDRLADNDKYFLNVVGVTGATDETHFLLSSSSITTAGPSIAIDCTDVGIDELSITNCTIKTGGGTISFGNDSDAASHDVLNNTFDGCGQIDPGDVNFDDNVIANTTASLLGAVLLDADGSSNWSGLSFISGGTGHAIYITGGTPHTFTNITFSGYGGTPGSNLTPSTGSTDAMVYNFSGAAVTINVTGGDTPSVRNGAGATTTIVQNVNVTVTINDQSGNPIPGAEVAIFQDNAARTVILTSTETDENGQVSTTASASLGGILIRARQSTDTMSFLTTSSTTDGVDDATDTINNPTLHKFQNGDAVVYSQNGGSQNINLTDGTTYYVNASDSPSDTTSVRLYTTAALAIAAGTPIALTAGGSETHQLDPVRFVAGSATGTIGATNFSAQLTLITDNIATG